MDKSSELRQGRHCVFAMHVPLVFVTKYRRDVFTREILQELEAVFASVCRDFGATLVGFDGEDDPVHLLVNSPRPFLSLPWSTASRGFRAAGSGKNPFRTFARNSGKGISGPPPISPEAAEEPPFPLFANTSNSRKPLTECQNSRTALPSALSFPDMNAKVCRTT